MEILRFFKKCAGITTLIVTSIFSFIPLEAAVIYSNFGPGMTFNNDPSHAWTINGFLGPNTGQQAVSQQFTPTGDYIFNDARVAVVLFSGPNSIDVFLQADSNGLPGAVIEEIPISGLGSTPAILTANSALFPVLQNGTPYWLTLVAGTAGVLAGWNWNSIGDASVTTFAGTQGGSPAGPWGHNPTATTRSAFKIDGTLVVSEPSSLVLLLGFVLATLGWHVRCRHSVARHNSLLSL